jgi:hypothetical protein
MMNKITKLQKLVGLSLLAVTLGVEAHAGQSSFQLKPKNDSIGGFTTTARDIQPHDMHCTNGGRVTVNVPWTCGTQFAADCETLGGTLSKKQPWGGKTCWLPD